MSSAMQPPFRAEHVGSLLRPPELRRAFGSFQRGGLGPSEFTRIQDRAIAQAVALQQQIGLEMVTDGEFRRGSYWGPFVERVEGLSVREARFQFRDDQASRSDFTAPHVESQVRRTRGIATEEFRFTSSLTNLVVKLTLPSPPTMHFLRGPAALETAAYPDPESFFSDLAQVYREELAELRELGARYVQLDEVPLAMLCDPTVREAVESRGEDPEGLVELYLSSINQALGGRPAGMVVALHLCRGNFKGSYLAAGGYEAVAERIFSGLEIDAFLLEYDTARAGGFEPLRFIPKGCAAILGLVSSKTPELESADELARRIDQASRHLDLDSLGISPQCGFASTVGGNPLTQGDQVRKLRLVVEVARRVWG